MNFKVWMQSKTGMWHLKGDIVSSHGQMAKCQSYNLDRPNPLTGAELEVPPLGAKVCKKCSK